MNPGRVENFKLYFDARHFDGEAETIRRAFAIVAAAKPLSYGLSARNVCQ
jgi:hypothetical protein